MIQMVLYAPHWQEIELLREWTAVYSLKDDLKCGVVCCQTVAQLRNQVQGRELLDLVVCDVSEGEAITALKELRSLHPKTAILPVADEKIPPASYVRPDIMPSGLLWRPLAQSSNRETLFQLLEQITQTQGQQEGFLIRTRQREQVIPYREILFIEAREKRLVLRMKYEEITFYGTLEQVQQTLPPEFFRAHKSFLINTDHIRAVNWSERMISLGEGILAPFSRGNRMGLKERINEIRTGE